MAARNPQTDVILFLSIYNQIIGGSGVLVINNIFRPVCAVFAVPKCNNPAGKVFCQFFQMCDLTVYDQKTALRQFFCKEPKGMTNIIKIFKKVQMIGFYIQDNLNSGKK